MHTAHQQFINDFWVVGINYKKTDASVRGLFAINNDQYDRILALAPSMGVHEFFILSTCNRTEIYGFAASASQLIALVCSETTGDSVTFTGKAYTRQGKQAIEHLFHVGAGLDSQILGDYEILGQIKNAVRQSKAQNFIGAFTERLINCVLQSSKAIKTHTGLSGGTVSTSFAAVQYIRAHYGCPAATEVLPGAQEHRHASELKIVLLGTGKIGRTTCRNLVDYIGTSNITLINRTLETATTLARELHLHAAPFEDMAAHVQEADIVLVSTSAREPVILAHHLAGTGRKLIIDFSVPSNVEPAAQHLPGITFVDVDMLSRIKDETLLQRRSEVPRAIAILEQHIAEFEEWCDMRRHVPVLKEVKKKLKTLPVVAELHSADPVCNDEDMALQDEKIQRVINSLATKMRRKNTPGCHYIEAINDFIA